jgi:hypothetical protein
MRRFEGPNRQDAHPARETTHPADLVPLRDFAIPTLRRNTKLRRVASENLAQLVSAAGLRRGS